MKEEWPGECGLVLKEPLIFERSSSGRIGYSLPKLDVLQNRRIFYCAVQLRNQRVPDSISLCCGQCHIDSYLCFASNPSIIESTSFCHLR